MQQTYRNIAVWLRLGAGATSIVYVPHGLGTPQFAPWNPGVAGLPEFGVPIGGPDSPVAGTLVGEGYSRDLLQEGIREGLFPLAPTYVVTDHDDDLMKLVSINGLPAYQALVLPVLKMAGIVADPGVVPRNAPAGLGGGVQGGGAQGATGTGPGDGGLISHPGTPAPLVPPAPAESPAATQTPEQKLVAAIEEYVTAKTVGGLPPAEAAILTPVAEALLAGRAIDVRQIVLAAAVAALSRG